MKRTRYIVAVALVATALCADQLATSAPVQGRPQMAQLAGKLVARLSVSFRHIVPATPVHTDTRAVAAAPVKPQRHPVVPTTLPHAPSTPFQYRLPPPTC